ncbi:MAG: hypothetical protein JO307_17020 [Bryobacterales bacterium]|nr:hypothetical protein [Bryobacterales bacterium]
MKNVRAENVPRFQMPPLAPRIVGQGLASDRVIIETVMAKYGDHLRSTARKP